MYCFLFLLFSSVDIQENTELNKTFYNNLEYLKKNVYIYYWDNNGFCNFDMSKLYYVESKILTDNKKIISEFDKKIEFKNYKGNFMLIFNEGDYSKVINSLKIKHNGYLNIKLNGSLTCKIEDLNKKEFDKYLYETYALFLTKNNIDLKSTKLTVIGK